jgi:hypothetical protein
VATIGAPEGKIKNERPFFAFCLWWALAYAVRWIRAYMVKFRALAHI